MGGGRWDTSSLFARLEACVNAVAADPYETLVASLANREHSRVELDRKLQNRHPALSRTEREVLLDR